jgi:ribosomal protein L17
MAGPIGNTNRANGKRFANALKAALEEYEDDRIKRGEALRKIAESLVADALAGDHNARREVADRLDGKPAQALSIDGDGEGGPVKVEKIVREVVRANP